MSIIFGVQIFMNKNIKNNIILKTEQNSSQAHHIKRQNLEEKHCRFRWGGSDLQSLQNQLLFYLGLNCLKTYIRFYLLNLRCHYYVQVRIQRGGQGIRTHPGKSQVIWVSIGNKQLDPRMTYLLVNILEDFENASPYFCTFLANRICDWKVTRRF